MKAWVCLMCTPKVVGALKRGADVVTCQRELGELGGETGVLSQSLREIRTGRPLLASPWPASLMGAESCLLRKPAGHQEFCFYWVAGCCSG